MFSSNGGSDFELPTEILNVLPTDPYEQLDLARKITSIAVGTRVFRLEAEASKLRRRIDEKEQVIHGLHEKISNFEHRLHDVNQQLSYSYEEQAKLAHEKNALAATVKKLNRDIAKLEAFKKTLMQSLQDQDDTSQAEFTDTTTSQRTASPAHSSSLASRGKSKGTVKDLSLEMPNITPSESPQRASPVHSPTRSPGRTSPDHSPKRKSTSVSSRKHSSSTSPTRHQLEGRVSLYSSLPASSHATAPNSPPHLGSQSAHGPRMDGKEFFRQARNRLSFEQFSSFLSNIKELNAHKQTREETLHKADEIFGPDNKDLYVIFDGLLSRNLH